MAYIDRDGYRIHNHIREHRAVMEQHLKRKLLPIEIVHHKNHNRVDNRIENLELLASHKDHIQLYHPSAWNKGKITRHTHKCGWCGKKFITIRQPKRKFCSRQCSAKVGTEIAQQTNRKYFGCKILNCSRPHCSKGMCKKHYYRERYRIVYKTS